MDALGRLTRQLVPWSTHTCIYLFLCASANFPDFSVKHLFQHEPAQIYTQTHTHTHAHAHAHTHTHTHTNREGERERTPNSKNFILKDSSVRSIWIYLTASPCYTTNTDSTTIPQTYIISTNMQLINAVSQSSHKCAETSEFNFFHGHICIQQSNF